MKGTKIKLSYDECGRLTDKDLRKLKELERLHEKGAVIEYKVKVDGHFPPQQDVVKVAICGGPRPPVLVCPCDVELNFRTKVGPQ